MTDLEADLKIAQARIKELEAQLATRYTAHDVAVILADAFGDNCACNFNGNDEWLWAHCEVIAACPHPVGVACWEQYVKHLDGRNKDG